MEKYVDIIRSLTRISLTAIAGLLLLSSCSRQYYYSPTLKGAQPITMPVAEPYTDIQIFRKSYRDLSHSDSLSALAHSALQDVLDGDNPWNLTRLDRMDAAKYEASVEKWAEECRTARDISDVDVPAGILEYMNSTDDPYLMFIVQKGIERDFDHWPSLTTILLGRSVPRNDFQVLVADRTTGKTAYYNRYYRADDTDYRPSDSRSIEKSMHHLLRKYPSSEMLSAYQERTRMASFSQMDGRPKEWIFLYTGVGTMYSGALPGYTSMGCETSWTSGAEIFPWQISGTPFSAGFGMTETAALRSIKDSDGNGYSDALLSVGPEVAYSQIVGKRNTLTVTLGLHYVSGSSWQLSSAMDAYRVRSNGMAAQASLKYHYRLHACHAFGVTLNIQSQLLHTPMSNPQSPIDNSLIAISYMHLAF